MIYTNYIGNKSIWTYPKKVIISNIRVNVPLARRDLTLAPDWQDVNAYKNGIIKFEELCARYRDKKLSKLNPAEVYEKYENHYALCCEADYTTCHRYEFAKWLNEAGYPCEEGLFKGIGILRS